MMGMNRVTPVITLCKELWWAFWISKKVDRLNGVRVARIYQCCDFKEWISVGFDYFTMQVPKLLFVFFFKFLLFPWDLYSQIIDKPNITFFSSPTLPQKYSKQYAFFFALAQSAVKCKFSWVCLFVLILILACLSLYPPFEPELFPLNPNML